MSDIKSSHTTQPRKSVSAKQVFKLFMVPVLMFGFGFALVPLYDVFCEITGLNGKTGRVEASVVNQKEVDSSRLVKVKFLANSGNGLPWNFEPVIQEMEVHPGQIYEAMYRVSSKSDKNTVGQAVPSVSPVQASVHFNKTECFCFSKQELAARETRDMPLRFVINHDLPKDIVELTLSYTFFNIEQTKS
ncbi:MAG: cytochrome c oxidase assembly protein [Gammaproteobacteria bacterium]|nr:cytochrome c oxidase assembly protein [Gammaproteobacteria bacterium]